MTARRFKFDIRRATIPLVVALAVLAVANGAVYFGLVRPSVLEWRALNDENEGPRAKELADRQKNIEEFEAYVEDLKQAKRDLDELRTALSTRDQRLVEVQRELEKIVIGERIDLNSVNYDHPEKSAGLQVLRMVVPLEGGYGSLRKLLNNVEKSELFLVVERVTLGQGRDGGVLLQLNVTIATFFNAPIEPSEERPRQGRRPRRA